MQAVILAAGESSRFYPFNNLHKSMVKVVGKPILEHTIEGLRKKNIKEIILVVRKRNGVKEFFEGGKKFGVSIDYVFQPEPLGAGNALILAAQKIKGDFLLLNAHRIDTHKFVNSLFEKKLQTKAVILAKQKENTQIHGVLKFDKDKVLEIVEKPKKGTEPSNLCVVGIYLLSYGFLKTLNDTPLEHYQLEKAISAYAKKNLVSFVETKNELVTLRYPWDLLNIKNYLFKNLKRSVSQKAKIAKSAEIVGEVFIEDGVSIMENVVMKGSCYLGRNSFVGNNAILRNVVDVGENAVVGANMEIKNSILMDNSTTHSGYIGDSIIGKNCKIAAGFYNANVRLDRENIRVVVKGEKVDANLKSLGSFIGDNSSMGIKVSTMPGVIIGKNVVVGAGTTIMSNIPDNTKYYTKFQEIVSKKNILAKASDLQKPVVLFDIDYTLFDTAFFKESDLLEHKIYEEVIEVLDSLSEVALLGIFSEGNIDFQIRKLKETNIEKYFAQDNTHIVLNKLDELKGIFERYEDRKIFFVDDKLTILFDAKKGFSDVFTIWVKRGPFAKIQKPISGFKPDAEIKSLSEVVRIVQTN